VKRPKIYGFDTGFVAYAHGWTELHDRDCGLLWEHVVLEALMATPEPRRIHFWRDKQRREVDFVLPTRGGCDAIECKWSATAFDPNGMSALRGLHPRGRNFVVLPHARMHSRRVADLEVTFLDLASLREVLTSAAAPTRKR